MIVNFGCNIGDILYYVDHKNKKLCQFQVRSLKVFEDNITAHGLMYGRYNPNYGYPMDISIKYLNKRCVYSKKKDAKMELEKIIA